MDIKVEIGIAIPKKRAHTKGYTEALKSLKVYVDPAKNTSVWLPTIPQSIYHLAKMIGMKGRFTCRKEINSETKEIGVRVWRVR